MSLTERKAVALTQKLNSLEGEFDEWLARSGKSPAGEPPQPLEKNHSQIRRITSHLKGFLGEIRKEIKKLPADDGDEVLAECLRLEVKILELHRIWNFFRSKLVLRSVEWFRKFLIAADEFAWACYQPAQEKMSPAHIPPAKLKAPPLIFLCGELSPFMQPRDSPFAHHIEGETPLSDKHVRAVRSLPVPVIGLPWFQVQHLPDTLIVGHEVGHIVETDFNLTPRLSQILKACLADEKIPRERQGAWQHWLGEVFADVYGNLAAGPAFTGTLIDALFAARESIKRAKRYTPSWGDYPTPYLRALVNLEVAGQCGFTSQSNALKKRWVSLYPNHAMQEFEEDVPKIVKALLAGPYPEFRTNKGTLSEVLSFPLADQRLAVENARKLLTGDAIKGRSPRLLLASARLAYEQSPEKYNEVKAHQRILRLIADEQRRGVRRGPKLKSEEQRKHDEAAGRELFKMLAD